MNKNVNKYILFIIISGVLLFPSFSFASDVSALDYTHVEVVNEVESKGLIEATLLENRGLSLAFVMLAGLVDGSNVCALSLLILFVGYLAIFVKDRKRSMKLGFIFLLTVFLSYFLMGILFSATIESLFAWKDFTIFKNIFDWSLIGILMIAGILNFQDFFFSKKFVFDTNSKERNFIRRHLKKIDIPTTIFVGFFTTIFLLLCPLPIYSTSASVLVATFSYYKTLAYILVYDLFFILPMLLVFAVILRMEKVVSDKDVHSGKFRWLKLVKGIIQIGAGIGLYLIL